MAKFKKNQVIEAIEKGRGFEKATVLDIFTEKNGKNKKREMYLLKIMCGTATIPVSVEDAYQLYVDKRKKQA